jgi:Holliday junction resolvase RusA-like endonuclease
MSYHYIVDGKPQVLQRHRFARGITYNPSKAKQIEFADMCELPEEPITGALKVSITFYFKRPMSHDQLLYPPTYPKRGDLDNLIKFVLDALNKKLYVDDSQIVSITANKCYCDDNKESRTDILFENL